MTCVSIKLAMKSFIEKTYFLSANESNAEGVLSLNSLTSNIIDIATDHANSLGIGNPAMVELNAGWILSRLTIDLHKFPGVNSHYVLKTWIEDFNRHFSTRCFSISSPEGEVYGYCRSIWLVIETVTHKNLGLSHLHLPTEAILGEIAPIARQEKHFPIVESLNDSTSGKAILATHKPYHYTFQYCDLDFYRHVNTVRYVTLLLNQFTLQEHDDTRVKRIELSFLHEAKYGMKTILLRSDSNEDPLMSSFQLSDESTGESLLFARIKREEVR